MRRIYLAIVSNRQHVTFFLLLLISVRLLFINNAPNVQLIRSKAIDTFSFFLVPLEYYRSLVGLHDENDQLRNQNLQLKLELEEFLNLKKDYDHLRELLEFRKQSQLTLVPANVLMKGITPHATSMIIDVGQKDGVQKNMAVVSSDGVVGKTILCGDFSSTVQIYTDMNFRISVRIQPNGTTGILRWIGGNEAEIQEVRKNADISIGDRVVTSGFSNIFPKYLPVGTVTGVENIRGRYEKKVRVELASDLSRIADVFVVIKDAHEE
ncbi:MAG: rod shape-determining protein MreC [FCB group bacterium]|nr:rod shape-determining protein MreC [FCB group bacterium]